MDTFLGMVGLLGLLVLAVGAIWLIYAAVRGKNRKNALYTLIAGIVMAAGLLFVGDPTPEIALINSEEAAKRESYTYLVKGKATNEQLLSVAEEKLKERKLDTETALFFFTTSEEEFIPITLGQVTWNIENNKFDTSVLRADQKDWDKQPSDEEYAFASEFQEFMSKNPDMTESEYAKEFVATHDSPYPEDEIMKNFMRIVNW